MAITKYANASKSYATQSTTIEGDVSYSQKLTTILLNEFNYLPWSRAITIALDGRSRLGFISGKNTNPGVTSPEYEAWLPKDQMVMSWILNSMERNIAEIFSYSESSKDLWEAVRDMYGNQNNSARIFQIQLDIANLRQDGNSFVNLLGKLKGLWNELEVYRPHSVDPKILRKRHEDDQSVCATIQREEIRRKVMINDATTPEARVYYANASLDKKPYKGKHSDLKCGHCNVPGHSMDRCWILHPELKLNFTKDKKGFIDKRRVTNPKAHMATHTTESFSSSPVALLNEFANYLQEKHGQGAVQDETTSQGINEPAALLSKFSSFLSNSNCESNQGIFLAF
ncbi:retrovirus-related pol polyprotein from transposon RE2 [Tanacetum coccineum]